MLADLPHATIFKALQERELIGTQPHNITAAQHQVDTGQERSAVYFNTRPSRDSLDTAYLLPGHMQNFS